eukprot:maker-scaffold722_size106786-snap-gene-0.20 protein:Tk04288 transcript:maker-scaffold722_size106786-snap-gene-0.20-mRNA-1 annotation:"beta- -galactosyltransferase 1"
MVTLRCKWPQLSLSFKAWCHWTRWCPLLAFLALVHPGRFSVWSPASEDQFPTIPSSDILAQLDQRPTSGSGACSLDLDVLSRVQAPKSFQVEQGGSWSPSGCVSPYHTVLVVPYRDREENLRQFLASIHPFLQVQNISYDLYVIEQTAKRAFNRAKLLNVGFVEARKANPEARCFIFHDVDLLPVNRWNIYTCTKSPRHMSSHLDRFRYNLPYTSLLGGAVAILRDQFEAINGFSNAFYGWGGEDDDLSQNRLQPAGYQIHRFPPDVNRYQMLPHVLQSDKLRNDNYQRFRAHGPNLPGSDGLSDLVYFTLARTKEDLFTKILVDI